MTKRKPISAKNRRLFFQSMRGECSICKGKIDPVREAWEIEHTIPLALGGDDDVTNWTVVHAKCHKAKTAKDLGTVAKAKRVEAKHLGAEAPKAKIPNRGFPKRAKPEAKPRLPPAQLYKDVS